MNKIASLYWRADQAFLKVLQESYLWLFDRTGIYAGTVRLFILAAAVCCWRGNSLALELLNVFICVVVCGLQFYTQNSRSEEVFNYLADLWERASFRHINGWLNGTFCSAAVILVLFGEKDIWHWIGFSANRILCIAFWNFGAVKIRPREPKKFFEREESTDLAMENV